MPDDPHDDDLRRVGNAWRELRRGASMTVLRNQLLGEGLESLDLGQADTLDTLARTGACRMSELAEALRVDASTATRAVDRLAQRGWVTRERSPDDARVVQVALTEEGAAVQDGLLKRRRHAMEHIVGGFSTSELATLADLLERMVAGLDQFVEEGGAAAEPPVSGLPGPEA